DRRGGPAEASRRRKGTRGSHELLGDVVRALPRGVPRVDALAADPRTPRTPSDRRLDRSGPGATRRGEVSGPTETGVSQLLQKERRGRPDLHRRRGPFLGRRASLLRPLCPRRPEGPGPLGQALLRRIREGDPTPP